MGMRPIRWSRVTQSFANPGYYSSKADKHGPKGHHTGIDFGKMLFPFLMEIDGKPIRSSKPGTVIISAYDAVLGNWVGVYYAQDDVTISYWHMQQRRVNVGDIVTQGQILGFVGNTGKSTAPHLHVQANWGRGFVYDGHINPRRWVQGFNWWRDRKQLDRW